MPRGGAATRGAWPLGGHAPLVAAPPRGIVTLLTAKNNARNAHSYDVIVYFVRCKNLADFGSRANRFFWATSWAARSLVVINVRPIL